jgi:hypothetical protein
VFISNIASFQAPGGDNVTDLFTNLSTAEVGVWNVPGIAQTTAGTNYWVDTKLFEKTFVPTDTDASNPAEATFANPAWLYNRLQFAQGTAGNPIATPIINTANIKRIKFDPYQGFVGTKATIVNATLNVTNAVDGDEYNFKFIIKSVPTDYLNYYDQAGLNVFAKQFPLGAFNTTNHKAINVSVVVADVSDADGGDNLTNIQTAIAGHPLLSNMFTAADVNDDIVITAIHPGVVFDLLIENVTRSAEPVACAITGQVLGVGNGWQVAGEEARCRSRYGNFNRMYLPQNMPTYTNTAYQYHKVTIEYTTNWPTSTGIAPAGATNQVVIYAADSGTAMVIADTNLDAIFNLAAFSAGVEYIWS